MAQSLWQGQRCKLLKFNFGCFAVLLTAGLSSVSSTTAADKSEAVKVAILRHSEAISQIDSYHIKLETHSSHLEGLPDSDSLRFGQYVIGGDRRLVHESTTEIWQSDTQRRWIDRTFFSVGEKGVLDFGQNGRVYEYSLDNSAIRFLSGWDWEHPPAQVPLEIARSFDEVSSVNCSISTADPIVIADKTSMDRAIICWDLLPGWSLARLAEACEMVELPQPDSTITRLQIRSVPAPDIFANASTYVGAVIDLDHKHGWLISRFEYGQGKSSVVRQANQFRQTENGFWYVSEWEFLSMGRRTDVMAIPVCEINQNFAQDKLQVQFPEGARVNDVGGRVHIWGAGGPRESFPSSKDYLNYQQKHVIEHQRGTPQAPTMNDRSATDLIIVINVGLIALVALLANVRKRLSAQP